MTTNTFASFPLAAPLLANVARLGFTVPTEVQAQAIPAALDGGDWMVSSQTGSGKTAAYLLPLLHHLLARIARAAPAQYPADARTPWSAGKGERTNSRKHRQGGRDLRFAAVAPLSIVLCPTRELAQQVASDAIELVQGIRGLRIATVVGGMPFAKQVAQLQGAALVIATPGRLLDLQTQRKIRLDGVARLVVDEADRMLDLGFADDLALIASACGAREQTLMYSATFAPRVMSLAASLMRNPGRLELASAQHRHADITQTLHWADGFAHKKLLLGHWLRDANLTQALVFASTQVGAEELAQELSDAGHDAAALHGAMPQHMRNRRLQTLRDGKLKILVATDVAARGIDVATISHVINFGLPMKAEDYVHRIGRTGRAGRAGRAITIAEFRDRHKIRAIEQFTQQPLNAEVIAGLEPAPRKARGAEPAGRRAASPGHRKPHGANRAAPARNTVPADRYSAAAPVPRQPHGAAPAEGHGAASPARRSEPGHRRGASNAPHRDRRATGPAAASPYKRRG